MGCINSKKKIGELRDVTANGNGAPLNGDNSENDADNVYRVRAVRLQPDMPNMCRNGYLELTPREIVYLPQGAGTQNVPIIWSLQHLRRYGVNGETFSFEAGRRCMTGAGIFTFRLSEAETLYRLFQRYINDVTTLTDDMFQFHNIENPRAHVHTNNYLEPTNAQRSAAAAAGSDYFGGDSNSPMSMDLDSPDSLPSLSFGANEVVHFSHNSHYTTQMQTNAVEQLSLQTTGNIYSDNFQSKQMLEISKYQRPMSSSSSQYQQHREHNNNNNNNNRSECSIYGGGVEESTTASAFSTMSRKLMVRRSSMDMPPKECAPLLLTPTTPTLRLYANIEQWADTQIMGMANDCYENINRNDLTPMQSAAIEMSYKNMMTTSTSNNSNPTTPGGVASGVATISRMASIADPESMSLGSGGEQSISCAATTTSGMNYIVLDLDHPRSPAATGGTIFSQYSPKTPSGSAFSIPMVNNIMSEDHVDEDSLILEENTNKKSVGSPIFKVASASGFENNKISKTLTASITNAITSSKTTKTTTTPSTTTTNNSTNCNISSTTANNLHEQMDYSTIDFVKTCALIESSVNGMVFNGDADKDLVDDDDEESRITRHSKCVRKAYSISE